MAKITDRRRFLTTAGTVGVTGIAGCSGLNGGGEAGNGTETTTESGGSEGYPAEPVTVVVPFGAGGGTDTQYRTFKPYFEEELGVNTVVDNRPGATGRTGFNHLSQQEPDGYTVGVISIATGVLGETLYQTQYSMTNLTSIGTVSVSYFALITAPDRFEDINSLRNTDREIIAASTGRGASSDFAMVSILDQLDVDFRVVPYDSGQELSTAVASGDTDIGVTPPTSAAGLVDDGRLKFLFIDRPDQSPQFPDAPTQEDVDFETPGIALELGMFGPAGVPDSAVSTLSSAITAAAENNEYREEAKNQGLSVVGAGPEETSERVQKYTELADRYAELRGDN